MGLLYCIKILTTLLMSALGVIPNAMADVRDHLGVHGRLSDLVKMIRDSREEAVKNFNMQP